MSLLFQINLGYAIAPNWKSFAIAHNGENQSFSAWDLENSKLLFKTSTKTDLYGVVYSPNSEIFLTINGAGENSAFYFWSVENKSMLGVFMPFHNDDDFYYLQNVLFSPDGQLLIAQNNGVFYVWGIRTK
jgi:WD40 repeat protein